MWRLRPLGILICSSAYFSQKWKGLLQYCSRLEIPFTFCSTPCHSFVTHCHANQLPTPRNSTDILQTLTWLTSRVSHELDRYLDWFRLLLVAGNREGDTGREWAHCYLNPFGLGSGGSRGVPRNPPFGFSFDRKLRKPGLQQNPTI